MAADGWAVNAVRYQPDYRTDEARAAVAAREAVTGRGACMPAVRAGLAFALVLAASAPVFADATRDLFMVVSRGTASEVSAAIAAGADPNARAEGGVTPLHMAAESNPEPSVVAALIEAGADPSARDGRGKTPFDYAKDNEALRGTEVYRRLDEARFK